MTQASARDEQLFLVREARNGSIQAFEKLFQKHHRRVFNLLYGMTGEEEEAADLTQEAFIKAYRSLSGLKAEQGFSVWLHRVAINVAYDYLRKRMRKADDRREDVDLSEEEIAHAGGPGIIASPEAKVERQELQGLVRKAVLTLSTEHRTVVILHHLQGLGLVEISQIVGCSVGTVKSRLARARTVLHRKLRPVFGEQKQDRETGTDKPEE